MSPTSNDYVYTLSAPQPGARSRARDKAISEFFRKSKRNILTISPLFVIGVIAVIVNRGINSDKPQNALNKQCPRKAGIDLICGEGGIQTPGTFDSTPDFESGTFDHSDTSPVVF
jgi:hypothetical protein